MQIELAQSKRARRRRRRRAARASAFAGPRVHRAVSLKEMAQILAYPAPLPRVVAAGERQPFAAITEGSAAFLESMACVMDSADLEVDVFYQDKNLDVRWGEATLGLAQQTGFSVIQAGTFNAIAAVFDGTDSQVALVAGGDISYLRVSKSGAVLAGPTATFTGIGPGEVDIAFQGVSLYYAFSDGLTLWWGRTGLTGSVQVSTKTLTSVSAPVTISSPRIAVNGSRDSLIVYTSYDGSSLYNIKALLVDPNGVVKRGPTTLYTSTSPQAHRAIKVFYDSELDQWHLFIGAQPYDPHFVRYGRLDASGFAFVIAVSTIFASTSARYTNGAYDALNKEFYLCGPRIVPSGPNFDNYLSLAKFGREALL